MSEMKHAAREASESKALETGARIGFAISGVLHLAIGWIALQLASGGGSGKKADQTGALQSLAENGLGRTLLWVGVVGLLALGIWQLLDAAVGHYGSDGEVWADRAKSLGKGVVYLALAWTAFSVARGSGSSGDSADWTAKLMDAPAGRWLVGAVGLGVLGVAGYHVWKGATKKFLEDLREHPGTWPTRAGQVGYIAKGVALAVVGVLVVAAAVQGNAAKSSGLDGALRTLRDQPFGPALLTAVAVGIAAYGLYSFSRAKNARL